jgi:hypothetical protein
LAATIQAELNQSTYRSSYLKGENKGLEYRSLNNIDGKGVHNEGRLKEYTYPPLPNIPGVRKAFLK